jgi:DNA-binding response OmpR family regulator
MRVLVVDDYPGAADIASVLIRLLGHDARPAQSGSEAVAVANEYDPELVVLDLALPDFDGYEVARRIRERQGQAPFIAALTGWDQPDKRVQSLASGIDMHVLKPACEENLTAILEAAQRKITDRTG